MRIHDCRRGLFKGVYDRSFKKTLSMYEHTIKRIWNGQSRTDIRISYASILTPQRYVKFQKGYARVIEVNY